MSLGNALFERWWGPRFWGLSGRVAAKAASLDVPPSVYVLKGVGSLGSRFHFLRQETLS